MENTEKKKPNTFKLESVTLLESSFTRALVYSATDKDVLTTEANVDVAHSPLDVNQFSVFVQYRYILKSNGENIVAIEVRYSGEFNKPSSVPIKDAEIFANMNAPAIIFPFIRETISSLTSKAMIGSVLIQPINFVKLYQDKRAKLAALNDKSEKK